MQSVNNITGANLLYRLDWRVQIAMIICLTIFGALSLIVGNDFVALVTVISFAPTPIGLLLTAVNDLKKLLPIIAGGQMK